MKITMSRLLPNCSACIVQKLAPTWPLMTWLTTTDEAKLMAQPTRK